ncbi:hypothetical protein BTH42_15025 [Burkholderia sp. SRS-W-2-2016]|uniref:LysR family transcriptional regulator n=1 Tax=Burkholderia sp. SRS-W-2-2016 TaxID=1926878 RepID=UPI00094ABEA5|nr:LysR substrate-binding domain-containing protein [Burkholderia sp. SRS-W-2-2016]OLL30793.1 hypothetical protein BTH42_15025 [Burkholderia sp. SRS-W-2-2016]
MKNLNEILLRRLRMRDLEILAVIGRTRSLSRTGERMAMTQPALSKWLRELEEVVGFALFERTTRRIAPTRGGEIVLQHAQRMLGDLQRVSADLSALQAGLGGVVRVGAPSAIAAVLLPAAAGQLIDAEPRLQIQLHEGTVDALLRMLQLRELDLVIGRLDAEALNAGCHHEHLYDGRVCVAARVRHPLQRRRRLGWKDTLGFPWIVPPASSPMHASLEAAFAQAGLGMPAAFMSSASILINKALAQQSDCLFVASLHVLQELERAEPDAVRHLPLFVPGVAPGVGMLWADDATPGVAVLMDALRNAARQLAG